MNKTKFRGMNLLAAKSANGNSAVMGINGDIDSPNVGDTVYAIVNAQGRIMRRADPGEFLHIALTNDEVGQRIFPLINTWEFPDWHCLAYFEQELCSTFWLYRAKLGSTTAQYGVLTVHAGPQSSGRPREGNGRVIMHREVCDLDIADFEYTMECHSGYSITTVVEALPSFKATPYDEWAAGLALSNAIPFEFEQGYYTALPTMVPHPPAAYQGTAARWQQAVEEVVGSTIRRPWTLMEVTWDRYDEMCASVGQRRKPTEEEE